MARSCVRVRSEAGRDTAVDVPPVLGRGVGRVDAEGFHRVDRFEREGDFWPARDAEKAVASRRHERHGREGLASADGAQDVEPGLDRAVVAGAPAYEREHGARSVGQHARAAVQDPLGGVPAEADPSLDLVIDMHELDMSEAGQAFA